MNDITKTIVAAAMTPDEQEYTSTVGNPLEELYEDEPESLEKEIALAAVNMEMEEVEIKKMSNIDEDGYYNPYPKNKHRSAEAEIQDRLLTIPHRPSRKNINKGQLWITQTNFLEQIALLNITKSEQKGLMRQWEDIQTLSQGEGNEEIVETEQNKFMIKIVSYKSRSDNPEKGVRERTAHITQKTIADNTVTMPKSETQKSGFLNTILGKRS